MADLEQRLVELGSWLDLPPAPGLAPRVRARIEVGERLPPGRRLGRTLAIALAVFLVAVGSAFAVPGSRDAILGWLGLQGATVERVVSLPAVPETTDLALGRPLSLDEARRQVGFPILVPEALGDPDRVYVEGTGRTARVSLLYEPDERLRETHPGVGLLLTQFRGDLASEMIGKLVAGGTDAREVTVDGGKGIWISGPAHEFFYRRPDGEIAVGTLRLAGNTLLWEHGNLLLRIESDLLLDGSLAVARSVQ